MGVTAVVGKTVTDGIDSAWNQQSVTPIQLRNTATTSPVKTISPGSMEPDVEVKVLEIEGAGVISFLEFGAVQYKPQTMSIRCLVDGVEVVNASVIVGNVSSRQGIVLAGSITNTLNQVFVMPEIKFIASFEVFVKTTTSGISLDVGYIAGLEQ